MVLLVVAVPVLIYTGLHVVLASNHGRLILSSTDPAKPGWEAAVEPTPTALMATLSETGDLSSVSLLALSSNDRSSLVFIPADTQPGDQRARDAGERRTRPGAPTASRPPSRRSWAWTSAT